LLRSGKSSAKANADSSRNEKERRSALTAPKVANQFTVYCTTNFCVNTFSPSVTSKTKTPKKSKTSSGLQLLNA
jgi:hypothetical protein